MSYSAHTGLSHQLYLTTASHWSLWTSSTPAQTSTMLTAKQSDSLIHNILNIIKSEINRRFGTMSQIRTFFRDYHQQGYCLNLAIYTSLICLNLHFMTSCEIHPKIKGTEDCQITRYIP